MRLNKKFVLTTLAFVLIGCGVFLFSTNLFNWSKGAVLPKEKFVNAEENKAKTANEEVEELYPTKPKQGDLIGELYIPKLDATLPIYHGTDEEELVKGVGHFAESVLPGEEDNSVLSGHRDTIFRKLGDVGDGDLLIARTSAGEFTYKVTKVRIVDEDDRTVIVPKPRATLTVSTCYPFYFVGAAPERYVLTANLISKELVNKKE